MTHISRPWMSQEVELVEWNKMHKLNLNSFIYSLVEDGGGAQQIDA